MGGERSITQLSSSVWDPEPNSVSGSGCRVLKLFKILNHKIIFTFKIIRSFNWLLLTWKFYYYRIISYLFQAAWIRIRIKGSSGSGINEYWSETLLSRHNKMSSLHKESKKNEQVLPKGGGWTLCLRRLTVEPRRDACAELGYGSSSIGNRAAAGGHRLLHGSYAQPNH